MKHIYIIYSPDGLFECQWVHMTNKEFHNTFHFPTDGSVLVRKLSIFKGFIFRLQLGISMLLDIILDGNKN